MEYIHKVPALTTLFDISPYFSESFSHFHLSIPHSLSYIRSLFPFFLPSKPDDLIGSIGGSLVLCLASATLHLQAILFTSLSPFYVPHISEPFLFVCSISNPDLFLHFLFYLTLSPQWQSSPVLSRTLCPLSGFNPPLLSHHPFNHPSFPATSPLHQFPIPLHVYPWSNNISLLIIFVDRETSPCQCNPGLRWGEGETGVNALARSSNSVSRPVSPDLLCM